MVNYNVARESFSQYIETLHKEWTESIDPECAKRLENNLLLRDRSQGGLLMMNFDQTLLTMFTEVHYWERLRFSIPLVAMEIQAQREKYRVLRENVLRVVRDYNKVLSALDKEERRLFQDRIQHLDRRIIPGVNKLQWTSLNHHLEYFTKEAVKYCRDGDVTVTAFKAANRKIEENCKLIAETLLVSVEKKKLYDHAEFEKLQVDHRGATQGRFQRAYEEIKKYMASTYQIFGSDSEDVQREWLNFTRKIDKKLEDALRTTVKKSLQELSRVLNGDKKNEVPIPIFNVRVQLEKRCHNCSPLRFPTCLCSVQRQCLTILPDSSAATAWSSVPPSRICSIWFTPSAARWSPSSVVSRALRSSSPPTRRPSMR